MATKTTPKTEAQEALGTMRTMLVSPEPLAGSRLAQFRGLFEYVEDRVEAIQELKRQHRHEPMDDATVRERLLIADAELRDGGRSS